MYEFYHYLPVNDTVMQWGLYLTAVGRGIVPEKRKYPPAEHPNLYAFDYERGRILPEFQVILITEGTGVFESKNTECVEIPDGTFIMLFPGIWHRYKPDNETGWKERWMSFNGTIAHYLMDMKYLDPDRPVFSLSDSKDLTFTFDNLLNHVHQKPTENNLLTSLRTIAFLSEVIENIRKDFSLIKSTNFDGNISVGDKLVNLALDLIWTHSHRQISVSSILREIPASRRTLERRFKKTCGHTIHDEIIQCRISRAKRLLLETDLPVKSIAYLAGFSHTERMRLAFDKYVNQSPSQYRKNIQ